MLNSSLFPLLGPFTFPVLPWWYLTTQGWGEKHDWCEEEEDFYNSEGQGNMRPEYAKAHWWDTKVTEGDALVQKEEEECMSGSVVTKQDGNGL